MLQKMIEEIIQESEDCDENPNEQMGQAREGQAYKRQYKVTTELAQGRKTNGLLLSDRIKVGPGPNQYDGSSKNN